MGLTNCIEKGNWEKEQMVDHTNLRQKMDEM